jgi:urea transport system substrate-binding protein
LETVNRRGYRFLALVQNEAPSLVASDPAATPSGVSPQPLVPRNASPERDAAAEEVPSVAARAPAPILVGVLHSLTGTMAYSESPVVDATLLAIDEINRRGGLLGRMVQAVVVDGKSDGEAFAAGAQSLLLEHRVSAIFGCWMSAHRKRVLPLVEQHDGLLLYPVQYEGLESSANIFYTGAAPNQQIIPAVRWAVGFLNCRRLFLIGSDYIFPRLANQIVRDQIGRLGGEILGEMYIPSGGMEVKDAIGAILAVRPELIVNTINGDSNIAFFRALAQAGISPAQIPTLSFSIGENELRNLDIPGNYAAWNYFQTIERAENRAFVRSFQARYGPQRVTSDPMEAAYLGVRMWGQAVRDAGVAETGAVRAALRQQSFNAPEGLVRIDPVNQHTWKTIRVGKITDDGQFEIIYSSEKPIRPDPYPDTRSYEQWHDFLASLGPR